MAVEINMRYCTKYAILNSDNPLGKYWESEYMKSKV